MTRIWGAPWYWLFSQVWSAASGLARVLASWGWLPRRRLAARVISFGNLQAGGAGKTPLVAAAARELAARGADVCILSRGYGGAWERGGGVIGPGDGPARAQLTGDEPALLHDLAPGAWIGVGADRGKAFERVLRQRGGRPPGVVLLDDGFQHWRLHRDLDVLALTSLRPWQTLFRDWPCRARWARLAIWTKGAEPPPDWGRLDASRKARVEFFPTLLDPLGAKTTEPVSQTPALWLVTGVADAHSVRTALEDVGVRIRKHVRFRDHARYDGKMVLDLLDESADAGCVLGLTGKDWVKWREHVARDRWDQIRIFEPGIRWIEGRNAWETALWGG
ncbi:MAG: tetraacyldisaccharide 4'-kinase [Bdellovibrionales bacterium]|nr:tetraacyldisaccharide 4'-kinase [Bdellovibrionales bacterium]